MLDIQIAVAKINKYASRESGDTVEVVERPNGGFTLVLADGQGSGRSAKALSHMVTSKVISMIKDGARDGAVARVAHDYLFMHRGGKVSATLNLCTVDLVTRTLVVSRNSQIPAVLYTADGLQMLNEASEPIGVYRNTKPVITEHELVAGVWAVLFSDGISGAGERNGHPINIEAALEGIFAEDRFPTSAADVADKLLAEAIRLDDGRPRDDMSVMALAAIDVPDAPQVRRMSISAPVD